MVFPSDHSNIGISVKRLKRKAKLAAKLIKPFELTPPAAVFFLFHTVEEKKIPWTHGHRYVTPFSVFKKQIAFIRKHFKIESTGVLLQKLRDGCLVRNSATIHFDDGFSSYANLALPYLREQNIPSTIFLINSVIDGDIPIRNKIAFCINMGEKGRLQERLQTHIRGNDDKTVDMAAMSASKFLSWIKDNITAEMGSIINDIFNSCRRRHQEESPFMDEKAVLKLKDNPYVEIGSHTIHHPMLSKLDENGQRIEIIDGHMRLERLIGRKLDYFAYPHGGRAHFNETSRRIIRESKRLVAFDSYGGLNYKLDRTDIKRITLSDHSPLNTKIAILKNVV